MLTFRSFHSTVTRTSNPDGLLRGHSNANDHSVIFSCIDLLVYLVVRPVFAHRKFLSGWNELPVSKFAKRQCCTNSAVHIWSRPLPPKPLVSA
jgi:hypothetical protein